MKISKSDALQWFEFFSALPEDEELMPHQQEIAYATLAQIEAAIDFRHDRLMADIKNLKTLETFFVETKAKSRKGAAPVCLGTG